MTKSKKSKETIGYIGMVLVVASFLFSGDTFYVFNLSGAIISAVYGSLISSKPVLFMNLFIMVFDVLHLLDIEIIKL